MGLKLFRIKTVLGQTHLRAKIPVVKATEVVIAMRISVTTDILDLQWAWYIITVTQQWNNHKHHKQWKGGIFLHKPWQT